MKRIGYIALFIILVLYALMFRDVYLYGEPWCDEPVFQSWSMA